MREVPTAMFQGRLDKVPETAPSSVDTPPRHSHWQPVAKSPQFRNHKENWETCHESSKILYRCANKFRYTRNSQIRNIVALVEVHFQTE